MASCFIGRCVIEKVLSVCEQIDWTTAAWVSDGKDWILSRSPFAAALLNTGVLLTRIQDSDFHGQEQILRTSLS